VLVTIPMMALMLLAVVRSVPRLLGSASSALREDVAALAEAWTAAAYADVAPYAFQVLGVVLPVMACALILGRIGFRFFRALFRWSRGSPVKRVAAAVLTSTLVTALCWAWWPNPGTYEPIKPGERGRFTELVPLPVNARADHSAEPAASGLVGPAPRHAGLAAQDRLSRDQRLVAAFEKGEPLPTKEDPVLAMVLVPADRTGALSAPSTLPGAQPSTLPGAHPSTLPDQPDDIWVFPFDKPLPPDEGDNQALAVNTTDGSVTYDLAFALVWAEGNEVLNVNEAHAYASCTDCVAVAVAFQVVLIMDDAQVVVPQNLSVAANYDCYRCITAAIASQLVLSVTDEPGQEQLRALGEVWNRLTQFAGSITSYSLTEITVQLQAFKAEIVSILETAPPVTPSPTATTAPPTGSSPPSPTPGPTSSPSPTQEPSSAPSPTPEPSSSPSATPETTSSSSPTQDTTSSPTPTQETTTGTPSPTQEATSSAPSPTDVATPSSTAVDDSTAPAPAPTTTEETPSPTSTTSP
jgi:putative peptide zinc metalloprotease protein